MSTCMIRNSDGYIVRLVYLLFELYYDCRECDDGQLNVTYIFK
jgi:hypothetical protein